MEQKEIEVILMRQLASCLTMPVFIVDAQGSLIFFNEPAELILGRRFEETGELPSRELTALFSAGAGRGNASSGEDLPISRALRDRRPVSGAVAITGLDNVRREVEMTAFPLLAQGHRNLGAVAIVQETGGR